MSWRQILYAFADKGGRQDVQLVPHVFCLSESDLTKTYCGEETYDKHLVQGWDCMKDAR